MKLGPESFDQKQVYLQYNPTVETDQW